MSNGKALCGGLFGSSCELLFFFLLLVVLFCYPSFGFGGYGCGK